MTTSPDPLDVPFGDWTPLFDGESLAGWRGYRQEDAPPGWAATDDGELYARGDHETDLVTDAQYADFELRLEWKLAEGGNSGILFRVAEAPVSPWMTGPEMQLLDDERHPDGEEPTTRCGANYLLHAPDPDVACPPGTWHEARIVAVGPHVAYYLDGQEVVRYEIDSDDWKKRLKGTKFEPYPTYGRQPRGHIALQDHGDEVWFRNLRIREAA